jgi:hypothetical protein
MQAQNLDISIDNADSALWAAGRAPLSDNLPGLNRPVGDFAQASSGQAGFALRGNGTAASCPGQEDVRTAFLDLIWPAQTPECVWQSRGSARFPCDDDKDTPMPGVL